MAAYKQPLELAIESVSKVSKYTSLAIVGSFFIIPAGFGILQYFAPGNEVAKPWYEDPFLVIMAVFFVVGQIVAIMQSIKIGNGARKVKTVLSALVAGGAKPDLKNLQETIMSLPGGHLRDLLVRWIALGKAGETDEFNSMIDNAAARRSESVDKMMNTHTFVNRTLLKFGFIGTLIGLMMTFPPMKAAILTLEMTAEEMEGASFVTQIADAIDGDAYAILTTLVATAFSVLIEMLTLLGFKRLFSYFEGVNNFVDEWCLTTFKPWCDEQAVDADDLNKTLQQQREFQEQMIQLQKEFQEKVRELQLESQKEIAALFRAYGDGWASMQKEADSKLSHVHQTSLDQISHLAGSVQKTGDQVGKLTNIQKAYGERVEELVEYERQLQIVYPS